MRRFYTVLISIVLVSILLFSCEKKHTAEERDLAKKLLRRIQVGMTQVEVAEILGDPNISVVTPSSYTWYLEPSNEEGEEESYVPGMIGIEYSESNRVSSVKLHPEYKSRW